jgi:hypothetical protein
LALVAMEDLAVVSVVAPVAVLEDQMAVTALKMHRITVQRVLDKVLLQENLVNLLVLFMLAAEAVVAGKVMPLLLAVLAAVVPAVSVQELVVMAPQTSVVVVAVEAVTKRVIVRQLQPQVMVVRV